MTSPSLQPRLVVRGRMSTASRGELSSIFLGEAELSAGLLMVVWDHQPRACCGEVDDAAMRGGARHEVAVSLRRIRAKNGLRHALGNALDLTGWCFFICFGHVKQLFSFQASRWMWCGYWI